MKLAAPLVQVAGQVDVSDPTPGPRAADIVLENTISDAINEAKTVVTTVLRTEGDVVGEEEQDSREGNGSLANSPDGTTVPPPEDGEGAVYFVNETTIVVTTVKGSHTVTTTTIKTLTAVQDVVSAPQDAEEDDGVKELLDLSAAPTTK
ncbi:hypothetical protein PHYPSEUDO_000298 [Phytophthora pseudosyringae]|uniref:Uncharacterized protein n=1 Tax=Phytophthora pseudosyringae TaxID=221518 RepID=A0A8T1V3N1_9STRA|nr:hypothetical protein PHYPSEUDO_000298 [Phytophthora pseudosyringae]